MRKNYSPVAYQIDRAFVDAVAGAMSPGLLDHFDISDRMHAERVRLLRIKSKNLFVSGGGRVSLDDLEKAEGGKPRYRAAAALKKNYEQARKNVEEYENMQAENAARSMQAAEKHEKPGDGYAALVENVCSGTVTEGGLVRLLMQRDRLEAEIAAARETPLFSDLAQLAKKAGDIDSRIKAAVESCPTEALPQLRKRAGYLMDKYYKH